MYKLKTFILLFIFFCFGSANSMSLCISDKFKDFNESKESFLADKLVYFFGSDFNNSIALQTSVYDTSERFGWVNLFALIKNDEKGHFKNLFKRELEEQIRINWDSLAIVYTQNAYSIKFRSLGRLVFITLQAFLGCNEVLSYMVRETLKWEKLRHLIYVGTSSQVPTDLCSKL